MQMKTEIKEQHSHNRLNLFSSCKTQCRYAVRLWLTVSCEHYLASKLHYSVNTFTDVPLTASHFRAPSAFCIRAYADLYACLWAFLLQMSLL